MQLPGSYEEAPSPCIVHDAKENDNFSRSFYLHHTKQGSYWSWKSPGNLFLKKGTNPDNRLSERGTTFSLDIC